VQSLLDAVLLGTYPVSSPYKECYRIEAGSSVLYVKRWEGRYSTFPVPLPDYSQESLKSLYTACAESAIEGSV
jgi:hypothetical protein